jgi:hypothetical protein
LPPSGGGCQAGLFTKLALRSARARRGRTISRFAGHAGIASLGVAARLGRGSVGTMDQRTVRGM